MKIDKVWPLKQIWEKHFQKVYDPEVCFKIIQMMHTNEQKLTKSCTPTVQMCMKIFFENFENFIILILAWKYNS